MTRPGALPSFDGHELGRCSEPITRACPGEREPPNLSVNVVRGVTGAGTGAGLNMYIYDKYSNNAFLALVCDVQPALLSMKRSSARGLRVHVCSA
jgi:hypothetical protein